MRFSLTATTDVGAALAALAVELPPRVRECRGVGFRHLRSVGVLDFVVILAALTAGA